MALANEQGRASMARALVAAMAPSVPVRVERGQPGACSGLNYRLGRLRPLPGMAGGWRSQWRSDREGKYMYEYSTEGLVADGCAGVARWSRLARRSRLELDYDLHASSLVSGWVLG